MRQNLRDRSGLCFVSSRDVTGVERLADFYADYPSFTLYLRRNRNKVCVARH